MADRVPWRITGSYIEACNCDFGCPCNYSGFPTKGYCEANVAFKVAEGKHGNVSLDGLAVVSVAKWPGAIHEGNGTIAVFIDERATEDQRAALIRILTAQDGGMPWEILAGTLTDIKGPFFAPISFNDDGPSTTVQAPGIDVALEPFTNPVTGELNEVHTVLPEGFVWKDGWVCKSSRNVAKVDGVELDWAGQNAYYAKIDWSNS